MSSLALVKTGTISVALFFLSLISQAQPIANFSASPLTGCTPLVVNFTDISTNNPTQWHWDLGNGTISFLQNPSATYFIPGQYNIKLVVQNAGGIDSIIKFQYIIAYAQPNINFLGSPLTGCAPLPVNFTDLSTSSNGAIDFWQWDFGDGNSSSLQNPLHTYNSTGNFNVSLIVENIYGCFSSLTNTSYVQISNAVHADFSNSISSNCTAPVTINFLNLSTGTGALSYLWDFGDGSTSTAINPTHSYTSSGSYIIQLIVSNSVGCIDTITRPNAVIIGNVQAGFTAPDSICLNSAVNFINTSTPVPAGVNWFFGDGTISSVFSPVKTYSTTGIFHVKLISNFGACIDSITKNITVIGKPTASFSGSPLISCHTPLTVTFLNTSINATSYQWIFGDGNTSNQVNPVHTFTNTGNYTISLISINDFGCADTLTRPFYVSIQFPEATINNLPQGGCVPFSWTFSSTTNSSEPVISYHWDFGDGSTSSLPNPTHIFLAGNYNIQLIVTTASGCTDTVMMLNGIRTGIKPVANFSADPLDVCAFLPINFFDQSSGTITQWLWNFGDGNTSTVQNPMHVYEDTGLFTISLVIWNNGCADTLIKNHYIHVKPPIASFSDALDCRDPLKRIFTDHSIGADQWNWDFGDGNTSSQQNPVHIYATPGIYTVTLVVSNLITGCSYTKTKTELVIIERADFNATDTIICRNQSVIFSAINSNPANISSYNWSFGNGITGNGSTITHTYSISGLYNVSLVIFDLNGCKDTLIKLQYIRVNGPTAKFTSSSTGSCLLSAINFTDSSVTDGIHPIIQWIWNYGDGIIDTLSAGPFQHSYALPGIYTVSLKVTDNSGCTDSIVKVSLLAISDPIAGFTADTISCPSRPVNFTNTSSGPGLQYHWFFGDGTTGTNANPIHTYLVDGVYTVKLIINDLYGCSDSLIRVNYINISTPIAGFTASDTMGSCPPLIVSFINTSTNYTNLHWDFGDGTTSLNTNPSHFYNVPGVYIAKLTISGPAGCVSIKQQVINIKGPLGSFIYTPVNGCAPLQVTFTATSLARSSFIWDFNDGTTISTSDSVVTHIYNTAGSYLPKMILLDAGGCVIPVTGLDTIHVFAVTSGFNFNAQTFCLSGTIQFNNTSFSNDQITGYVWNFGDGFVSNLQNPTHFYSAPGLYYPSLKVTTLSGCSDSIISAIAVRIASKPDAQIFQTANACIPVTITFNGLLATQDTTLLSWQWNFGNGISSNLQDPPTQTYSTAGNYQVTLWVTNRSGCIDTVQTSIQAYALPNVYAGVDTMICKGIGRSLMASGASNYTWTPSTGLSCTNCAAPLATPDSITTYMVTGTNSFGCSNKDSVIVKVQYPFNMNHSPADTLCKGNSIRLYATGAYSYVWSPSTGLSNVNISSPVSNIQNSIIYQVIGKDDKNCFSDTAYIPVSVFDIPTVEAGPDKTINVGQMIDLIPVISNDVIDVLWSPTGSIFRNFYPSITAKPRETTTYTVVVKNSGGCISRDQVTVNVLCDGANVFIPNTFSPNGDGVNDIFYPRGTGLFRIKSARIFNRWGEVVYEKGEFMPNDPNSGWDGTYKGKILNVDVYVYLIEIICDNNALLIYKGNVALVK